MRTTILALALPLTACRVELTPPPPPPLSGDEFSAFSTLNDELNFADAGYGASLLLGDELGRKGAVVFRASENGIAKLVFLEFDITGGNPDFRQETLAENVGDLFRLCVDPSTNRRVVVGPLLQPGGTAYLSLWQETDSGWSQHYIDQTDDNGRFAACAVDDLGAVHIAYTAAANQTLRYALWQGGVLITQPDRLVTVDDGFNDGQSGASGNIDSAVSLALTPSGLPRVTYYDANNGQLRVASQKGDDFSWQIQVVGATVSKKILTVDSGGIATVNEGFVDRKSQITVYKNLQPLDDEAYVIEAKTQIRIIDYDPAAEYEMDFVSPISLDYGVWSSLAIAPGGEVYAAIYDLRGGRLVFASNLDLDAGGAWQIETIDEEGLVGGAHDLKLQTFFDDAGVQRGQMPVVVYQDIGNSDLLIAYRGNEQWVRRRLVTAGLTGFGPSLQLTSQGQAVIAYREHRLSEGFPANLQVTRALPIQP